MAVISEPINAVKRFQFAVKHSVENETQNEEIMKFIIQIRIRSNMKIKNKTISNWLLILHKLNLHGDL